ncbi:hypothetical protein TL5118_02760 [Thalassovita autumnalis]|uniref:Uncharacterized protein n=1 Tax=Thalassovita autumnalis TaxID=2072972 RepID=A0A0N7LWD4_9RHOB|nr:hypothetical protein TL5118_02760 [Thalassovita autumnalis]CUH71333.1 hypothetical protein TL5120_01119 [Thalassovita autumnalis]
MACQSIGRVNWLTCIGLSFSTKCRDKAMALCESGCVNWRMNGVGLDIVVWESCLPERALK